MNNQIPKSIVNRVIKQKDLDTFNISSFKQGEEIIRSIDLSTFTFRFKNYEKITIADNFESLILLKYINRVLRSIYKVKQSDRHSVIKTITSLLLDEKEKWIVRTDIKEFYESIPTSILLNKIQKDGIVSYNVQSLLRKALRNHKGLPRGLCISATLSELFMRDFDAHIKGVYSVFYYARYVDDIIIFSYQKQSKFTDPEQTNIIKKIYDECKKNHLEVNLKKSSTSHISIRKDSVVTCDKCDSKKKTSHYLPFSFEYLGYRFTDNNEIIDVNISTNKIKKIKSRIVYSFLHFKKTKDIDFFEKQIKFLTTNFITKRDDNRYLLSGIYYNYPLLNKTTTLQELTTFYHNILFSSFISYQDLSKSKRQILHRYSFLIGYNKRIVSELSIDDIIHITQIWRHYEK